MNSRQAISYSFGSLDFLVTILFHLIFPLINLLRLIVGTVFVFFFFVFLGILPSNFSFECGIFILKLQNLRYDTKYSCNSLLIII